MVDIRKSLGTDDAGTVLIQPEIDKVLQHLVEFKNPLRQNLPRKSGSGPSWYLNRRTPGTTGAQFVADKDTIDEDQGSYARVEFPYKTIAAKGKVTRKMQAIGRSYIDVLAEEIEARVVEFKDYDDWALFRGSITSSANQYDGLDILVTQTVSCATTTSAGPMTLAKLDQAIDTCSGDPNMIIASKRSRRVLNQLLQSQQRFVNIVEVRGGFKVMTYNGIPIFTSTNILDTMLMASGGASVAAYTGGDASSLYILDTEFAWVGELTPLTIEPLAKTSSQFDEFDLYCDEALVIANAEKHVRLIGISGSTS